MLSPIQTRQHFLKKVYFEPVKETYEDGSNNLGLNLNYWEHEDHWHVSLGVRLAIDAEKPKGNHRLEVIMEGLFDINPEFPKDKIEEMVKMNGGAILYGAIREVVVNLTCRSKYLPVELPSLDARVFIGLAEKQITEEEE